MTVQTLERIEFKRPIDNRATPQTLPPLQTNIRANRPYQPAPSTPVKPSSPSTPVIPINKPGLGSTNLGGTDNSAKQRAMEEAAYYSGFYASGIIDQLTGSYAPNSELRLKRDLLEDLSYEAGRRTADGGQLAVQDATNSIRKIREDLWRNRPKFEIPEIKLPELPKIKKPKNDFPELPGIKIREFNPNDYLERQIDPRPSPLDEKPFPFPPNPGCYQGVAIALSASTYGYQSSFDEKGRQSIATYTFTKQIKKLNFPEKSNYLIGEETDYRNNISRNIFANVSFEYETTFYQFKNEAWYLNNYAPNQSQRSVTNRKIGYKRYVDTNTGRFTEILLYDTEPGTEDYYRSDPVVLTTTYSNLTDIYGQSDLNYVRKYTGNNQYGGYTDITITKRQIIYECRTIDYTLPPKVPPKPPRKKMCCPTPERVNYALIQRILRTTLEQMKYTIEIPIVSCELKENEYIANTTFLSVEVFATNESQALQIQQLHISNAEQSKKLCELKNERVSYSATPDSWLIRPEHHRPQIVFQFSEIISDNKYGSPKYEIVLPHPKVGYKPSKESPLPIYRKGNWEMIYVLKDNSKITLFAQNENEGFRILEALKSLVNPAYLEGSYLSKNSLVKGSREIAQINVVCKIASFFEEGRKNSKPLWRVNF